MSELSQRSDKPTLAIKMDQLRSKRMSIIEKSKHLLILISRIETKESTLQPPEPGESGKNVNTYVEEMQTEINFLDDADNILSECLQDMQRIVGS